MSDYVFPADRLPYTGGYDRALVGVPGGIPNRTTIASNLVIDNGADPTGLTNDAAIWQAATDAIPSGQVLYVPPGSFRFDSPILRSPFGPPVTIRGAGIGVTTIYPHTGGADGAFYFGSADFPRPSTSLAIVSGATKDSTQITVADASTVTAGKFIRIQQSDLSWVHNLNTKTDTMSFMALVTSKNATQINFTPPLPFTLTSSPVVVPYATAHMDGVGFEDLTIDMANCPLTGAAINFQQAYGCYVNNVEIIRASFKQIVFIAVQRSEVRDCYIHDTNGSGPNHEGIDLFNDSCSNLVENNILVDAGFPHINFGDSLGGCSANAATYNYSAGADSGSSIAGSSYSDNHGPHNMFNLWEGNKGQGFVSDGYYGSASHGVLFRNRLTGRFDGQDCAIAVKLDHYCNYYTAVGNVLGDPAVVAAFDSEVNGVVTPLIRRLGYPNMGNSSYGGGTEGTTIGPTTPPDYTASPPDLANAQALDLNIKETIIWHRNFDYANNSIVDEPSEGTDIAASLLYPAQPAWWPSGVAWPPINPTSQGTATNPAEQRFLSQYGTAPALVTAPVETADAVVGGTWDTDEGTVSGSPAPTLTITIHECSSP